MVARVPNTLGGRFNYLAYEVGRTDARVLSEMDRKIGDLQAMLRSGAGKANKETLDRLYAGYNAVEKEEVYLISDRQMAPRGILEVDEARPVCLKA